MKEFSELCGISERYLADIEHGAKAPKLDTFVRIANTAGVSADLLLQDSLTAEQGPLQTVQNALQALAPDQREIVIDFLTKLANSLQQT